MVQLGSPEPRLAKMARLVRTARQRLVSALSWNALSALALQGSVLISMIAIARILGAREFGAYAVLLATATTLTGIAQGGTGVTATKFVAEWLHQDRERIARMLRACRIVTATAGIVAALALLSAADFIADVVLGQPQLAAGLAWIAVAIVFQVVVAFQHGALIGLGAFATLGRTSLITGGLYCALSIGGAYVGGLEGATIGYALASFARAAVFSVSLRLALRARSIPVARHIGAQEWRALYSFALPATLAGYVTMPCLWGVTALVARQPDGLQMAALLAVAHQLRMAVLQVPALLNAVTFSALGRLKGQGDRAGQRDVLWSALGLGLVMAGGLSVAAALGSEALLSLYGAEFVAGQIVLLLLLASVLPEFVAGLASQLVQVAGRMWTSLWVVVCPRDLSYLLLAAVLLASHGVAAAAAAYLVAQFLGMALAIALAARSTDRSTSPTGQPA